MQIVIISNLFIVVAWKACWVKKIPVFCCCWNKLKIELPRNGKRKNIHACNSISFPFSRLVLPFPFFGFPLPILAKPEPNLNRINKHPGQNGFEGRKGKKDILCFFFGGAVIPPKCFNSRTFYGKLIYSVFLCVWVLFLTFPSIFVLGNRMELENKEIWKNWIHSVKYSLLFVCNLHHHHHQDDDGSQILCSQKNRGKTTGKMCKQSSSKQNSENSKKVLFPFIRLRDQTHPRLLLLWNLRGNFMENIFTFFSVQAFSKVHVFRMNFS